MSAVAGGSLEAAAQATMPLITAHAKGIGFTIVAPGGVHRADVRNALLLVKADGPIRTARDLNWQVVASNSLGDVNDMAVHNWVDKNGGDSSTLHPIELPYTVMAAALLNGRVAAASLLSPILDQALQAGGLRVLADVHDSIAKHFMTSCWFAMEPYVTTHRDAFRRFAGVMRETTAFANTHHAETVDLLAAFTGLDSATIARSTRRAFGSTLGPSDLQPLIDVGVKYKVIPKSFPAADLISPAVTDLLR